MNNIGSFSLNLSFTIYLFYFIPQIIHNFYRNYKNTEINYITHIMMIISNSIDLVFSFANNLQWQYCFISISNLMFILIHDLQIYFNEKIKKNMIHFLILLIIINSVIVILTKSYILDYYQYLGYINICLYSFYWIPQIIYNFKSKYNNTFSILFLQLNLIAVFCDFISGITLSWPYSSIITSCIVFFLILIIIIQYIYYNKKFK